MLGVNMTEKVVPEKTETQEVQIPTKRKTTRRRTTTSKGNANVKDIQKVDVKKTTKNSSISKDEKISDINNQTPEREHRELKDYLPSDTYFPKFSKYGIGGGYVMIPGRVFIFIYDNSTDWYMKMDKFGYYTDVDFLYTLLYYIIQDGYVNILDMGTNSYHKLTIRDEENNGAIEKIKQE